MDAATAAIVAILSAHFIATQNAQRQARSVVDDLMENNRMPPHILCPTNYSPARLALNPGAQPLALTLGGFGRVSKRAGSFKGATLFSRIQPLEPSVDSTRPNCTFPRCVSCRDALVVRHAFGERQTLIVTPPSLWEPEKLSLRIIRKFPIARSDQTLVPTADGAPDELVMPKKPSVTNNTSVKFRTGSSEQDYHSLTPTLEKQELERDENVWETSSARWLAVAV
ncbi:uncharacterized protein EV422DRAFT_507169 [Fimicolochytrium jonesii]|uniref:uncharacterized protein n=1 Tax=Fimicolochytrium jonesii TaxID=1396493 RepID=UPI0022FE3D11|nr:uncharacterized protein EV422DRAFT_507169 [Fimicolochytrium jonesii]KAI8820021.1 hypothetical protein EV422DRAFT_507169 [Fimicolochytrium jonesii]